MEPLSNLLGTKGEIEGGGKISRGRADRRSNGNQNAKHDKNGAHLDSSLSANQGWIRTKESRGRPFGQGTGSPEMGIENSRVIRVHRIPTPSSSFLGSLPLFIPRLSSLKSPFGSGIGILLWCW